MAIRPFPLVEEFFLLREVPERTAPPIVALTEERWSCNTARMVVTDEYDECILDVLADNGVPAHYAQGTIVVERDAMVDYWRCTDEELNYDLTLELVRESLDGEARAFWSYRDDDCYYMQVWTDR